MGLNGLEPSTSRLSGVRSNQLSYRPIIKLKRVTRIELASPAWKAGALTIVLHLHLPSSKIVSLDILP